MNEQVSRGDQTVTCIIHSNFPRCGKGKLSKAKSFLFLPVADVEHPKTFLSTRESFFYRVGLERKSKPRLEDEQTYLLLESNDNHQF